jgi:RNA-directed DNA polymerase
MAVFCHIVGGVLSPLLGNLVLHQVLDEWYVHTVKPRLRGRSFLIRYGDGMPVQA